MATDVVPTNAIVHWTDLPPSTLAYWVRMSVLKPTVSNGLRRSPRYWSVHDAVAIRAIQQLRHAGAPIDLCRTVPGTVKTLMQTGDLDTVLCWEGGANPVKAVAQPQLGAVRLPVGALATHVVVLPVWTWEDDLRARSMVKSLNVAGENRRRDALKKQHVNPSETTPVV